MSRSDRLLRLMQVIRRLPSPVTAARLASEMEVSERSIYRDIQSLRASGALIDGEAGFGYTLEEDPFLPPMHFDEEEVEALASGLRSVMDTADESLRNAAENALAKLEASLPRRMRNRLRNAVTASYSYRRVDAHGIDVSSIRRATWEERALQLDYQDAKGEGTVRKVWPLALVFVDGVQVLLAWCLLREDYRVFRLDRIQSIEFLEESFKPRRVNLLRSYYDPMKEGFKRNGSANYPD